MAKEREKNGENVTLFAPRAAVERLQRAMPNTMGLTVYDFETRTSPAHFRLGLSKAVKWLEHLPSLDSFENVVCDNLPEILAYRPDSVISAQFFWHDVVEGAAPDYIEHCEELLARHDPIVIGCEHFAMEAVRKRSRFQPVPLYKNPELVAAVEASNPKERTDLLVTGGTTPLIRERLQEVINKLLKTGPEPYRLIHVDPQLAPQNAPTWMVKADFSVNMYCQLRAAVCRPGLGVVTDLMTVGAEIFPIFESGNEEMKFNASLLKPTRLRY